MSAAVQNVAWESWALHVEEITGLRIHEGILDSALEAWERGETADAYAIDLLVAEARANGAADTRARPFEDADDPSSPLLSAATGVMLLVLASAVGWAIAPGLYRLFSVQL